MKKKFLFILLSACLVISCAKKKEDAADDDDDDDDKKVVVKNACMSKLNAGAGGNDFYICMDYKETINTNSDRATFKESCEQDEGTWRTSCPKTFEEKDSSGICTWVVEADNLDLRVRFYYTTTDGGEATCNVANGQNGAETSWANDD